MIVTKWRKNMSKINRRNFLTVCGSVSAGLALSRSSAAQTQTELPKLINDDERTKKLIIASRDRIRDKYFPNIELTTHEGKKVKFYDDLIKDKIVTINFMYATCDGICPGITRNLAKAQKLLGDIVGSDVFMYSITLKPKQDTVQILNAHAQAMNAKPGWLFLTGTEDDIELLRRRQGFVDPDPILDKDKSNHTGNVRYGNEKMQYWGSCPGLDKPERLVESLLWLDPALKEKYMAQKNKMNNMNDEHQTHDGHQHKPISFRGNGKSTKRGGGK